ncbi:MAG: MarR family winged helix-turn-helix transcriptional regulator [Syntrophomonadaceae bacterium]
MGEKLKQRLRQEKFSGKEQEALLNLFLANNFIKKRMDDICAKSGITSAQYNVLRILRGVSPEGYPRCEIIPRMIDQAPDVTRIIDNLEKQDLILRESSPEDRRLSITKITRKGISLIQKMEGEVDSLNTYLKDSLTEDEINKLSAICEKIYCLDK